MSNPFLGGPPSEEAMAEYQRRQEEARARVASYAREAQAFFAKLSEDDLILVKRLLYTIQGADETNCHYQGLVTGLLMQKHDLCFCESMWGGHTISSHYELPGEETVEPSEAPVLDSNKLAHEIQDIVDEHFDKDITGQEAPVEEIQLAWVDGEFYADAFARLKKHPEMSREQVEDHYKLDHSDQPEDRRVQCRRCGLTYISLEDRLLKDECHGCQQAEKSGAWKDQWA